MGVDISSQVTYLDNASTAHPKPACVWEAARDYLENVGANPGRSGSFLTRRGEEMVERCRTNLGALFNIKNLDTIALTFNATHALNTIIQGVLRQGDHVVITNFEHNSVIRPLETLRRTGVITYDVVESTKEGFFRLSDFEAAIRPRTKLIVVNHASNVIGVIAPIRAIITRAHEYDIEVLVDASQTAGFLDIDVEELDMDYLVFTGHKALGGASGTGGFYARNPHIVRTLMQGGSGTNSLSPIHPSTLPDKFEAGTMNYLGIAGLTASLGQLLDAGVATIRKQELELTQQLLNGLATLEEVTVYGTTTLDYKVPVVSFTVAGQTASEVATILDQTYKIMVRPGLQCAPLMHKTLGTSPDGTVRVSLGASTTDKDIQTLLAALHEIIYGHPALYAGQK